MPATVVSGVTFLVVYGIASGGAGDLAQFGPFFAVDTHPPGRPPRPPWRPLAELVSDPRLLGERIAAVRTSLARGARCEPGETDLRAAASTVQLGLAARLIAPAVGAAVLGMPLDLRLAGLRGQDKPGGPMPLSIPAAAVPAHSGPGAGPDPADGARRMLDEVIAPVTAVLGRLGGVPERTLWGNVASAVNTAAAQVAGQRPDLAAGAWNAAGALFADPRLERERQRPGPAFRRTSCCLFWRIVPGIRSAVCGDCVLAGTAPRQR